MEARLYRKKRVPCSKDKTQIDSDFKVLEWLLEEAFGGRIIRRG